ncbi:MAG: 4Fe-4S binding protein [Candidatus Omnitrophica bacterium]|nr:4Fe-4S binding protein [Candidatus Omnitrophota bacterium]
MKYPKLRELKEAIRALIKGAYTSKFPYKPHEPFEKFRGRPKFYEKDCVGCTACVQVCPARAISYEDKISDDHKAKRVFTIYWDLCIFCGQCEANCLTGKGIMLSREFDLATTGKRNELRQTIEKELVTCECCGEPIVPYDQYVWLVDRLGPLVFSNSSSLLFYMRRLGLSLKEQVPLQKKEEPTRSDRLKIICPRCRRQAVLKS